MGIRPTSPPTTRLRNFAPLLIFILALLVRLPRMSQSLWYDEMYTLVEYVQQPWQKTLACRPGEYVPNNHVLQTILARISNSFSGVDFPPNEALLRLPSLLAGSLLPIALAWPLRRSNPIAALILALLAAAHPWLIAFSTEARGYSLLLLLGVIATNLLPDGRHRWPIGYALTMAAAIYTIPIALLLLPAHALAVRMLRRNGLFAWMCGAAIALLVSGLLYLPMARAMMQYYRQPYQPTITYREFLDQLPRFALAGQRLPEFDHPPGGSIYWALPLLVVAVGTAFGWAKMNLRPMLISFAAVSLLGIVLPLICPTATEVRFVPWAALWLCIAFVGILVSPTQRWTRVVSAIAVILLLAWMGLRDAIMPPNQPVREAIALADHLAPAGERIMIGYLGAREAAYLYGDEAATHEVVAGHDVPRWLAAEQQALAETGHLPWVVILYEDLARRRDAGPEDSRGLWTHLIENYRLVARLDGRITPVAIYSPREQGNVAMIHFDTK